MTNRRRNLFAAATLLLLQHAPAAAADWIQECRTTGFDPEQLACSTCAILPSQVQDSCRACCSEWLGTERISKPYQAAVLVERGSGGGEVGGFLKEEWENVVQEKGASRLKHIQDENGGAAAGRFSLMMYGGFLPSVLLFFDSMEVMSKTNDISKLTAAAKESISLDGLEKADLKDMLLTLLP